MASRSNGKTSINAFMELLEQCYGLSFPKMNGNHLTRDQLLKSRFTYNQAKGEWILIEYICTQCKKGKHPDHFNHDKTGNFGLKAWCRSCEAKHLSDKKAISGNYVSKDQFDALQSQLAALLEKLGGL